VRISGPHNCEGDIPKRVTCPECGARKRTKIINCEPFEDGELYACIPAHKLPVKKVRQKSRKERPFRRQIMSRSH
jgi:hypothetical protein